jgi:hypothetical protein
MASGSGASSPLFLEVANMDELNTVVFVTSQPSNAK